MMPVWEAVLNYNYVKADLTSTQDQIREAGIAYMRALRNEGRPFPRGLSDEILDARNTVDVQIPVA